MYWGLILTLRRITAIKPLILCFLYVFCCILYYFLCHWRKFFVFFIIILTRRTKDMTNKSFEFPPKWSLGSHSVWIQDFFIWWLLCKIIVILATIVGRNKLQYNFNFFLLFSYAVTFQRVIIRHDVIDKIIFFYK